MITYKIKNKHPQKWTEVYLGRKHVGNIYEVAIPCKLCGLDTGYQYVPKGQKEGGTMFPSLALCKKSWEEKEKLEGNRNNVCK